MFKIHLIDINFFNFKFTMFIMLVFVALRIIYIFIIGINKFYFQAFKYEVID